MFELKAAGCLTLSDDGHSVANSQLMRMAWITGAWRSFDHPALPRPHRL